MKTNKKLKQPRNKTKKKIEKKGKYGSLFLLSYNLNNLFMPTPRFADLKLLIGVT